MTAPKPVVFRDSLSLWDLYDSNYDEVAVRESWDRQAVKRESRCVVCGAASGHDLCPSHEREEEVRRDD